MQSFTEFLNRLGLARVAAMAVVAVLMLGFFALLTLRVSSPNMAPLYNGLSLEDSSAITKELQSMNVPFELQGDGDTILVPRDQVTTVRMSLAGDGLPTKGQVGYEIFDQQNTLGATSFVQNINNVRALEGELARTITSLDRIKSARVHLVLPQRELFSREQQNPTASIVLSVRGELSAGQIGAIQHLVAAAVEGLTPDRVAIVDDAGQLLASGDGGDGTSLASADYDERVTGVEDRLKSRVEDMLNNVVGPGRARVQVSVELNLDRSTKTTETFDPNGQVVHSSQTRNSQNTSTGGSDQSVSVSNSLPGAAQNGGSSTNPAAATAGAPGTAPAGAGSSPTEQAQTNEETTNYDNSKTTETQTSDAGGIKRLTVAVAVDGNYKDDGKGNQVYSPRNQTEIDQIRTLVQSAVGFDKSRGDDVQVVNLQFAQRPAPPEVGSTGPGLFDFTRDDLINWAQMAVTLIIALALVLFVMRPLIKKVLAPEAPLALPPSAELLPAPEQAVAVAEAPPALPPDWMNQARALGEQQMKTLQTIGGLVDENPKQAATIVRDWLHSAA
ncbi:MAG TPA: flagellar basal-body MS-ring/collar protein FliF [Devosia sp.]|nr:flagellar basal-body MS-ring/collar protein FliF [Devosia sp.]